MNTHYIMHLLVSFYKAHYEAIFILAILARFGLLKFIWDTIGFIGELFYLSYAYCVVGCRKLRKVYLKFNAKKNAQK